MIKTYTIFFLRLLIVIGLYYGLEQLGVERWIILIILLGVLSVFIIYGLSKTKSYSGYLEVVLKPTMHYEAIEHLRESNKDYFNLLKAYGLYYQGFHEEARRYFNLVQYSNVSSNAKLDATYYTVKLGLLYEEGNKDEYRRIYQISLDENIFLKVRIHPDIFKVKEFVLLEQYDDAIELAMLVIPKAKPRLLIIELEYLLALSYFKTNRLDDCNAVCEFISEKDYQVVFTELCREFLIKMNTRVY